MLPCTKKDKGQRKEEWPCGLYLLGGAEIQICSVALAGIVPLSVLEKQCRISFPSIFQQFHSCPWFSNSCQREKIIQETVSLTPKEVCHPGYPYVPRFPRSFLFFSISFFLGYSLLHLLLSPPTLSIIFVQMNARVFSVSTVLSVC